IGPKLMEKIPCDENNCSYLEYLNCHISGNTFELKSTTSSLEKLCKSKATGLDKISAKLLRYCPDLLSESLTVIFNCSINTAIFPDEWKCSKVLPLFKHGERRDLNNYRPISIIPVVAKVFERIIYDQIYAFLTDNNLLCNSQSGFRSLHSTVTALLESTNNWAYNIDQGRVNAVVFLDLKKAFDTVNHDGILLSKLNAYGLGGAVANWFKSYLSDRSQKCYVNGHLSNNRTLLCGIPQGTILGPLLFLLYINDLPNCLEHSQARMYADDTNLTFAIPCLEIDGVSIDKVLQAKSLGVYLDENLSWNIQINELTKKIASASISKFGIIHLRTFHSIILPSIFRDNCLFIGANVRQAVNDGRADFMPVFLSEIPLLFRRNILNIDVALVQVSPPDRHGFCSLGPSVDIARSAIQNAKYIIALSNPSMPRTFGDSLIHKSHVDVMVEVDYPLPELKTEEPNNVEKSIGKLIAENLVEDGATLQMDNDIVQNSHERQETEAVEGFEVTNDCLGEPHAGIHEAGRLPDYVAVDIPSITIWGRRADGSIITVNSSTIINAYHEITRWRKNTFLVPYGKVGRDFIDQLTQHINDWNNASQTQHIALKAAIVLLATALQKPSVKSKAKDHKECLEKRLALWKEGEVESLLREGRSIQKSLAKAKRTEPPNKAKIFAKLVMEGQINSALRYLSEADCDGVLPLTDDVMRQLQEKRPEAQEAKLGSLLFGPFEE
ncbi:RNA-directed DNA polymerase from mobile element jockey-like, partial [Paramuricea clavata]